MMKHSGIKDKGEYFEILPLSRSVQVPVTHRIIGTEGEHLSEQVTFKCPQIIDGHDISQCARHFVSWRSVNSTPGHDELRIDRIEEEFVYFVWDIRDGLTADKGLVQFSIHFEDIETEDGVAPYRWGTTTCKNCEILESINAALGAYEAVYVAGDALVFADYTPVSDKTLTIGTNGLVPEGTKRIETNGIFEVGEFAQVEVDVPPPEPPETPYPSIEINQSGKISATASGKTAHLQLSDTHDPDFVAENIKKGVNIFGVDGCYEPIYIEGVSEPHPLVFGTVVARGTELHSDAGYTIFYSHVANASINFDAMTVLGHISPTLATNFVEGSLIVITSISNRIAPQWSSSVSLLYRSDDNTLFVFSPTSAGFSIELYHDGDL